jgi:predicted DsbA family dithiol-disulfide isomerase
MLRPVSPEAKTPMKIDVWSDVVCPWCWLGKARLDSAVAAFPHPVEVVFRSFELDPRAPKERDVPTHEMLTKKYGLGRAQIDALHQRMHAMGLADGIEFRFDLTRTSNTFEAHEVIHHAHSQGKQKPMVDRLFRAQFHEGVRVGDRAELLRLAAEVGLDRAEVEAALDEQRFTAAVRADEEKAHTLGISGVPFYVVDGVYGVSGAQSVDVLRRVLEEAWSNRAIPSVDSEAGACDCSRGS